MPGRMLTAAEEESIRLTELAEAMKGTPQQRAAQTYMQPGEGQVKLYDPHHVSLKYGPGNGPVTYADLIVFGNEEDNVAIVDADHPLLPKLLREYPGTIVMKPGEKPGRVYSCEDCDEEFASKALLSAHRREAHPAKPPKAAPQQKAAASGDDGA